MPEQLDPLAADVATPQAAGADPTGQRAAPSAAEVVALAPEEVAKAVAADEKAWQAVLRAKAEADPELGKRLKAAGLIGVPLAGAGVPNFLWDPDDVQMLSPAERETNQDLQWAFDEEVRGAFDAYRGDLVAIVNKKVLAVGRDEGRMIAEAAAVAGVEPNRVVIFEVDSGEF